MSNQEFEYDFAIATLNETETKHSQQTIPANTTVGPRNPKIHLESNSPKNSKINLGIKQESNIQLKSEGQHWKSQLE